MLAAVFLCTTLTGFFIIFPLPKNRDPERLREMEQKGDWHGILQLAEERIRVYSGPTPQSTDPANIRGTSTSDQAGPIPAWYQVKGYALFKLQRWNESIDAYKLHLAKVPNNPNSMQNLGAAYFNANRVQESVDTFTQLSTIRPDMARVWYELGHGYYRLGNHAKVKEIHGELRRRDNVLAAAYEQNFLKATSVPTAATTTAPTETTNTGSVTAGPSAGNPIASAQQAIAKEPRNSSHWVALGRAYMDAKQSEEAKRALEEAIRIEPSSIAVLYEFGRLAKLGGDTDKVRELYQQINLRDAEKGAQFFKEFLLP